MSLRSSSPRLRAQQRWRRHQLLLPRRLLDQRDRLTRRSRRRSAAHVACAAAARDGRSNDGDVIIPTTASATGTAGPADATIAAQEQAAHVAAPQQPDASGAAMMATSSTTTTASATGTAGPADATIAAQEQAAHVAAQQQPDASGAASMATPSVTTTASTTGPAGAADATGAAAPAPAPVWDIEGIDEPEDYATLLLNAAPRRPR